MKKPTVVPLKENTEHGHIKCEPAEATHLAINMPRSGLIILPVIQGNQPRRGTNCWSWNGDLIKPTLKPSILTNYDKDQRCHSFLNDGMVQMLSDCTHDLAGQTVPLGERPDFFDEESE